MAKQTTTGNAAEGARAALVQLREAGYADIAGVLADLLAARAELGITLKQARELSAAGLGGAGAEAHQIPTAAAAEALLTQAWHAGRARWLHLAVRDLCEAAEASGPRVLRARLIHAAATLLAWVDAIDRAARPATATGAAK